MFWHSNCSLSANGKKMLFEKMLPFKFSSSVIGLWTSGEVYVIDIDTQIYATRKGSELWTTDINTFLFNFPGKKCAAHM